MSARELYCSNNQTFAQFSFEEFSAHGFPTFMLRYSCPLFYFHFGIAFTFTMNNILTDFYLFIYLFLGNVVLVEKIIE